MDGRSAPIESRDLHAEHPPRPREVVPGVDEGRVDFERPPIGHDGLGEPSRTGYLNPVTR